jgi:outer membrane protein assembly factor BamB
MARWSSAWTRRGLLAAVLIGAAIIPGYANDSATAHCASARCGSIGTIRWVQPLTGSWTAESGVAGTVLAQGEAYVAAGPQVAVTGYDMNVYAFDTRAGTPLWATTLTGFPDGAAIVSVRSWPQVVTVGVDFPSPETGGTVRDEVVLGARSGQQIRSYPAALYGGAVAADSAHTVVVGTKSVTSYLNASGRAAWSLATGAAPQAWKVDGHSLYVTVSTAGYLGSAPVTAVRRINLGTGAERVIRPSGGTFAGTFSAAFDGVLLFSGSADLSAYLASTGELAWQRAGVVPQSEDLTRRTLYVTGGNGLTGLDPGTGAPARRSVVPASSGLFGVRDGVAFGLDQGALGDAWGYAVAQRRVVWTTPPVPWPHYFNDLSGLGGSTDPVTGTVLLAACARLGGPAAGGGGQVCLRPELVAIRS